MKRKTACFSLEFCDNCDGHNPALRAVRPRTQDGSPEAETQAEAVEEYCLPSCSPWIAQFAFLYHPGPPSQEYQCLYQLLVEKVMLRLAYRPVCWRHFLHLNSHFRDHSSLYEVDKKLCSTTHFFRRPTPLYPGRESCALKREAVPRFVHLRSSRARQFSLDQ